LDEKRMGIFTYFSERKTVQERNQTPSRSEAPNASQEVGRERRDKNSHYDYQTPTFLRNRINRADRRNAREIRSKTKTNRAHAKSRASSLTATNAGEINTLFQISQSKNRDPLGSGFFIFHNSLF